MRVSWGSSTSSRQASAPGPTLTPSPPPPPQVFVETLDRCFENVCELDLIFHVDRVHNILQEICIGGMVLETNMSEILTHIESQTRQEKSEATAVTTIKVLHSWLWQSVSLSLSPWQSTVSSAPNKALSAVKNIQSSATAKLPGKMKL